jgi:hypothetical protein
LPLDQINSPIVAAWFADVDTPGPASQSVRYGFGSVDARRAFCIDFDRVGYFSRHDDVLNSFQLFIVDRTDARDGTFDIVLRYRQLQWEAGDASGGLGRSRRHRGGVGYSNGSGQSGTFLELLGSRQPGTLLTPRPRAYRPPDEQHADRRPRLPHPALASISVRSSSCRAVGGLWPMAPCGRRRL